MGGIRRMCKAFGSINLGGVLFVWDYHRDDAFKASEMTKEQTRLSQIAKGKLMKEAFDQMTQDLKTENPSNETH